MKLRILATIACFGALAPPAWAHHSFAMFDMQNPVTYEGVVEEFRWMNPHGHIILNVPATASDPKTVGRWDIEGQATNIMARQGWSRSTLKPGDKVTILAYPMRDGSKAASIQYAVVGGKRLYGDVNHRRSPSEPR